MHGRLFSLSLCAAIALAACSSTDTGPAPIGPQVVTASVGASQSNEALQAHAYFPQALSINAGDAVEWTFPTGELHSVTLLGPQTAPPAATDPTAALPAGPANFDGSSYVSSGFLVQGKTFREKFTKPGTYTYQCLIHTGMKGTITVAPTGSAHVSDQSTYDAQALAQKTTDLASVAGSIASFPYGAGGPHLVAGMSPGLAVGPLSPLTVLRFLNGPSLADTSVTILAGQTLTWTNESNNEIHTVTFGPAGAVFPNLNNFGPPLGGNVYDGTTVVSSGILAPGKTFSLQFTKPGTYTYHCLIHDDTANMIGTVVVQ